MTAKILRRHASQYGEGSGPFLPVVNVRGLGVVRGPWCDYRRDAKRAARELLARLKEMAA